MWKVDYEMGSAVVGGVLAARPFQAQQATQGFNSIVRPKRYESSIPSWSWASVIGPIAFQVGRLDTSDKDQISHVRKDGRLEGRKKSRVSMLKAVDFDVQADSLNEFGPPRRASMRVTGLVASVIWAEKEKTWGARIAQSQNGGLLVYKAETDMPAMESLTIEDVAASKRNSGHLTVDFEPDLRDEDLDVSLGDSLVLLFVVKDLEATVGKEQELMGSEKSQKVVWGVPGVMLEGLVLVPVEGGEVTSAEVYRRVGIFTTADEGWSQVSVLQTISAV